MLKKGYKIIVIKDGQFDLKQFHINKFTVSIILLFIPIIFSGFYFTLSLFDSNSLTSKNSKIDKQLERINDLEYENKNQASELKKYEEIINK